MAKKRKEVVVVSTPAAPKQPNYGGAHLAPSIRFDGRRYEAIPGLWREMPRHIGRTSLRLWVHYMVLRYRADVSMYNMPCHVVAVNH